MKLVKTLASGVSELDVVGLEDNSGGSSGLGDSVEPATVASAENGGDSDSEVENMDHMGTGRPRLGSMSAAPDTKIITDLSEMRENQSSSSGQLRPVLVRKMVSHMRAAALYEGRDILSKFAKRFCGTINEEVLGKLVTASGFVVEDCNRKLRVYCSRAELLIPGILHVCSKYSKVRNNKRVQNGAARFATGFSGVLLGFLDVSMEWSYDPVLEQFNKFVVVLPSSCVYVFDTSRMKLPASVDIIPFIGRPSQGGSGTKLSPSMCARNDLARCDVP